MRIIFTLSLLFSAAFAGAQPGTVPVKDDTTVKTMTAVIVATQKRAIEIQPDKTILTVDASVTAAGQNALDFLRQAPGVVVDATDNIGLNGKTGVTVLLDGRNTQLSAQDLAQLLKSIDASNIKQIEIITNPSAKYDAAGNAGIINIKLKKSLANGFNGNLTGSHVQSTHARERAGGNFNWRLNKLNFFSNGSWTKGLQHTLANNDRTSHGNGFTQRSIENDLDYGHSIRTGVDYTLSKKSVLGILWMKNSQYTRMLNQSNTLIQQPSLTDTAIYTSSYAPFPDSRNSFNLNYNSTGKNFTYGFDADYTTFHSSLDNRITNDTRNNIGAMLYSSAIRNNADVHIKLSSVKGDMDKTFAGGVKLETGFKLMQTKTNNDLQVQTNLNGEWLADTGKTNNFRYNEEISAVYASIKKQSGKWNWQAGLRAEHTNVEGRSVDLKGTVNNRPDTAYLNFFPTFYLQYQVKENHQLGIAANRRIDRPSYQDQNPFIYVLDALNSEQGNPYLMPQFTNSVEVSYTHKWATSVKISYAHTSNYFEGLTYQSGKNTIMITQNAGTRDMLSVSFSTPLKPCQWWNMYLSLSPYYHYYNVVLDGFASSERQNGGSIAHNGYIGNNFTLGKGWKAELNSWFNYQNRATIYVSKPLGSVNAGVQKNILKEKATLKLSVIDIFNTQRWQQTATTNNLQLTTYRKWESQNMTLGFSWRFGNSKIKNARERQSAAEVDVERIK